MERKKGIEGVEVASIEPTLLAATGDNWKPVRLTSNKDHAFQGVQIIATSLIVDADTREKLLAEDPRSADLLRRFVNGITFNGPAPHHSDKWVIDFGTLGKEKASEYYACFAYAEEHVMPEVYSQVASFESWKGRWWQFWRPRPELRQACQGLDRVIAMARTSKLMQSMIVPSEWCLTDALVVFAFDDHAHLAILNSSFHWWWSIATPGTGGSSLKTDPRYTTSAAFETFPLPAITDRLEAAGQRLEDARLAVMNTRRIGLNVLYGLVSSPEISDADIEAIRQAHIEIDIAMLESYVTETGNVAWLSIDPDYGFYDTPVGNRWVLGPTAQRQTTSLLVQLNRTRHLSGLSTVQATKPRRRGNDTMAAIQEGMFEADSE